MSTEVAWTLVGIVIGGVLTGAFNVFLAARKEQRDRREASRLVAAELLHVSVALGQAAPEAVDGYRDGLPPVPVYEHYRGALARELPGALHTELAYFVGVYAQMRQSSTFLEALGKNRKELSAARTELHTKRAELAELEARAAQQGITPQPAPVPPPASASPSVPDEGHAASEEDDLSESMDLERFRTRAGALSDEAKRLCIALSPSLRRVDTRNYEQLTSTAMSEPPSEDPASD